MPKDTLEYVADWWAASEVVLTEGPDCKGEDAAKVGDLEPFILHQRQKSWKAPVLPWQALLTLESWPLVYNKTQHVAAKAECVCAERIALPLQPDVPKLGDTWEDRKGVCGPREIQATGTVPWVTAPGPQKALDRWQVG